jgi:hypothetical protein
MALQSAFGERTAGMAAARFYGVDLIALAHEENAGPSDGDGTHGACWQVLKREGRLKSHETLLLNEQDDRSMPTHALVRGQGTRWHQGLTR